MNKVNGVRISGAMSYLTPAVRSRANLTIQSETLAHRVLFYNGQAIGIEVECKGEIHARNIILSCVLSVHLAFFCARALCQERYLSSGCFTAPDVPVGSRLLDHPELRFMMPTRHRQTQRPTYPNALRYTSEPKHFTICRFNPDPA